MAGHEPTKRAVNAVADAGRAWALGTELLASLVGGGLIGFAIDYFAGTFPWFMLILGGLGLVGGFIRVVRAAAQMNAEAARRMSERSDPDPGDSGPAGTGGQDEFPPR